MQRPRLIGLVCLAACTASGCAALSLFSQTHYHTHGTPDLEERLQAVEERAAMLESRLASLESSQFVVPAPELPAPAL